MITEGATPFEKGLDFISHFQGKQFTVRDIQNRYHISYRQANRLKAQVDRVIGLKPVGFGKNRFATGTAPFLWEINNFR